MRPLLGAPWHAEPLFMLVTIVMLQKHVKEKMKDIQFVDDVAVSKESLVLTQTWFWLRI